tara:strand:- start:6801 stop:7088 length:288 start_codon:yes stop_codon:yes gene_type:complete
MRSYLLWEKYALDRERLLFLDEEGETEVFLDYKISEESEDFDAHNEAGNLNSYDLESSIKVNDLIVYNKKEEDVTEFISEDGLVLIKEHIISNYL